jgi:GNAT superfamily N-acetyltransferase
VHAFAGKAFEYGTAHYVEGFTGAALWHPPDVLPDEEALSSLVLRTVSEEMHEEVFAVLEQQVSYHPTEPHWYLPFIGVDPALQGKGYGSALLRHALAICDRNHQIAYLDASRPQSIPLYERQRFRWVITSHFSDVSQSTIEELGGQ